MNIHFVYPADILNPKLPDPTFQDQIDGLKVAGFNISLLTSGFQVGNISKGSTVVYRGWMLTVPEYQQFALAVLEAGSTPFTTPEQYALCHHLPNWYRLIPELTAETVVYGRDIYASMEFTKLGWNKVFIKDYVKSNKTSIGSAATSPEEAEKVLAELKKYRGEYEGGVCFRRFEEFVPDTEKRFFILGKPYSEDDSGFYPKPVVVCPFKIHSPFYSVDVACRNDGEWRVVEIGDGQVSDLVGKWDTDRFVKMWKDYIKWNQ